MNTRPISKVAAAAFLAAVVFATPALAAKRPAETDEIRLNALQDDVQKLKREFSELKDAQPASPPDQEFRKKLAEFDEKLRQAEQDIAALKGFAEETERALAQIKDKLSSLGPQNQDQDLKALSAQLTLTNDKVAELQKSVAALEAASSQAPTPGQPTTPAAPPKTDKEVYDEAYGLYRDRKYPEAQARFREYAERFPDTSLTDNAVFWIGETYYEQGQYEQAILQYDKVVQKFPNGDKVPSSIFKQGLAFYKMGDNLSARILLKKVITEYPSSEQAVLAKRQLELLPE